MKAEIKVGFCVAYDWELLRHALPLVYPWADVICLSMDQNRTSWSGNSFAFDDAAFLSFVRQADTDGKVRVYEDCFYKEDLSPMQNEVRQRNMIAAFMGTGGWHIQLDCDEYFLNFDKFISFLKALPAARMRKANVCSPWITLYKQVQGGFFYVDPESTSNLELMQVATREPFYEYGRRNGNFNIYTNFRILHQSWARPPQQVREKIHSWGHSADFEKNSYFEGWYRLAMDNYHEYRNFHFLKPEVWPRLNFVSATSIEELILKTDSLQFPCLTPFELFVKNSRAISKIKKLVSLIIRTADENRI